MDRNFTKHKILNIDSSNMYDIENNTIQLIVTSPPYPMIEMWDELFISQNPEIKLDLENGNTLEAYQKMHIILNKVWDECDRVLEDNGFICINIGDATRTIKGKFQLFSNHSNIIKYFENKGYSILPDIVWRKQSNSPNKFMGSGMYPAGAYVTYEHEHILVFRKGEKRIFNNKEKIARHQSAYFWEERNVWFSDLWDIKGVSQTLKRKSAGRERNASFPFDIPYRLVNMYSVKGDTVLDPFSGLATTSYACMVSQRNSIGCEIDNGIASLSIEELKKSTNEINNKIDNRLKQHMDFIDSLTDEKREKCYTNIYHNFLVKTKQEKEIQIQKIKSIYVEKNSIYCEYSPF